MGSKKKAKKQMRVAKKARVKKKVKAVAKKKRAKVKKPVVGNKTHQGPVTLHEESFLPIESGESEDATLSEDDASELNEHEGVGE